MPKQNRVRADIAINEHGVRTVDLVVPTGHREDAFKFFERMLPGLEVLDRTINTSRQEPSR